MSDTDKLVKKQRHDQGSIRWCRSYPGSAALRIANLERKLAEAREVIKLVAPFGGRAGQWIKDNPEK